MNTKCIFLTLLNVIVICINGKQNYFIIFVLNYDYKDEIVMLNHNIKYVCMLGPFTRLQICPAI